MNLLKQNHDCNSALFHLRLPSPSPSASSLPLSSLPLLFPFPPRSRYGVWGRRELSSRIRGGTLDAIELCCIMTVLSKRLLLQHFWFFGQHCNERQGLKWLPTVGGPVRLNTSSILRPALNSKDIQHQTTNYIANTLQPHSINCSNQKSTLMSS